MYWSRSIGHTAAVAFLASILIPGLHAQQLIPNSGQRITPTAPTGSSFVPLNPGLSDNPQYVAGQAVTTVVSPDGKTLLVLTSGYNRVNDSSGHVIPADSTQFVFVYDISQHRPNQKQVIQVPNTYSGICFDPSGNSFYVSGGVDDNVHAYSLAEGGKWTEARGSPITLGHNGIGVGLSVKPQAAGIAIAKDGSKLVVANYYNDSISVLTKSESGWALSGELDLRPGKEDPKKSGVPGGEYPLWVAIKGNDTAYISSIRDREIVVVNFADKPTVAARIRVPGQPNRMVLNASQSTLYIAQDNTDSVGVIDTSSNRLVDNIGVAAPAGLLPQAKSKLRGNDTNSVTLSRDEKLLYVTNGWMNDVAVIQLSSTPRQSHVVGLIPTGWYPNSISFSADGKFAYVVNGKSPTGPNSGSCLGLTPEKDSKCRATNQYNLQLIKAGLQSFPTPSLGELQALTQQVASNDSYKTEGTNRDINVGYGTLEERKKANPMTPDDPDDLPGTANAAAPDAPDGENGTGYLWNAALRAHRSVRNYGFFIDLARYSPSEQYSQYKIPLLLDPASTKTQVSYPASAILAPYTDIYFRSFDNAFPDYYRFKEWEREFDTKYAKGGLLNLSLVRFMHDHTDHSG